LQDRVSGVEVAVREVVSDLGDLPPRDGRLCSKQVIGKRFDRLADLQQPDRDGIEYQAVGQVAAPQGVRCRGSLAGRQRRALLTARRLFW
jgi:hypothetical protein